MTWDRINGRHELGAEALRALGDALLRTGDAAAAAIADGHAAAEREIATRSASALRELLDAILDLPDGDEAGRARLVRRAGELAIPLDRPLTVVVADAGRDLQDGDPAVAEVARRLVPGMTPPIGDPRTLGGPQPGPVVAASAGRLVVLVPDSRRAPDVAMALAALGDGWTATSAPAPGLLGTAAAVREATAALSVARRSGRAGSLVPAASLALERALLAEPELLRAAVDRELGPLLAAPGAPGSRTRSRRSWPSARTSGPPLGGSAWRRGPSPTGWSGSSGCSADAWTRPGGRGWPRRCSRGGCLVSRTRASGRRGGAPSAAAAPPR